jgi:hypothetical protein
VPLTLREYENSMHQPALCELLPVRDFLDGAMIRTNGAFVAGYELGGMNSYYNGDEMRNRMKGSLEALARALPERSMRMQVRFEIVEGLGDLRQRYNREQRSGNVVLQRLNFRQFNSLLSGVEQTLAAWRSLLGRRPRSVLELSLPRQAPSSRPSTT